MLRKCLFPVAGYGTRFLPATKAMPKEMLPIVNKPLVQYGVEEAIAAGLCDIGFVTGRGKEAIENHFDFRYELEKEIEGSAKAELLKDINELIENNEFAFTRQTHMRGLGHAILTGHNLMGDHPFAVVLADDLCITEPGEMGVLAQMVAIYQQFRCSIVAIEEVEESQVHNYGIVDAESMGNGIFRVKKMIEKPRLEDAPSRFAIIGRYILTPDIFDRIRSAPVGKGGEIQITDALMNQAQDGCVIAYQFRGKRFDCGSVEGFIAATNYVYQNIYKNKPRLK